MSTTLTTKHVTQVLTGCARCGEFRGLRAVRQFYARIGCGQTVCACGAYAFRAAHQPAPGLTLETQS